MKDILERLQEIQKNAQAWIDLWLCLADAHSEIKKLRATSNARDYRAGDGAVDFDALLDSLTANQRNAIAKVIAETEPHGDWGFNGSDSVFMDDTGATLEYLAERFRVGDPDSCLE